MAEIVSDYSRAGRDEIGQLQLERLQAVLHRVYKNVDYYRESFRSRDFFPDDLVNLETLRELPLTGRATLTENHPYGMYAVHLKEVIRLQSTSSVPKESIVVGFTQNDIDHWTDLAARSLVLAGVEREDLVHICIDYGLFPGALGLHYGAEKIGASVIPGSSTMPDAEFEMMKDYHTTVLLMTPHRALRLCRHIEKHSINAKTLTLRACLLVGQYWSESVRTEIEETLLTPVFDCYGHSEIVASGIAAECEKRNGLHINEDHFIPEIVDPETDRTLEPGKTGELVITTLTKEAFPLIRYRTGDITRLDYETCTCGRTFVRMARVSNRTDDMVLVGGVNLFPSQVERIIAGVVDVPAFTPVFQLVLEGSDVSESVEVLIEVNEVIFSDELRVLKTIEEKIRGELLNVLGVAAKVRLVEPGKLSLEPRGTGRVVDRRGSTA
jgi:phenylacetate-CoA ligase